MAQHNQQLTKEVRHQGTMWDLIAPPVGFNSTWFMKVHNSTESVRLCVFNGLNLSMYEYKELVMNQTVTITVSCTRGLCAISRTTEVGRISRSGLLARLHNAPLHRYVSERVEQAEGGQAARTSGACRSRLRAKNSDSVADKIPVGSKPTNTRQKW